MATRTRTIALTTAALVAIPIAVLALTNGRSSMLDRQTNARATKAVTTSSTTFVNLRGLVDVRVCAQGQVTAILSVGVSGAPARFRVLYEDGPSLFPAKAEFDPVSGTKGFSFTFVGQAGTFEGLDQHVFTVQWRSATGAPTNAHGRLLDLLYHVGARC
jgi:hypothetical protein